MHKRRQLPKVIYLCLLTAIGMLAITAGDAQAKGDWRIDGVNIAANAGVTGEKDTHFWLETTFMGSTLRFLCKKLVVKEGLLFTSGSALAILELTECETLVDGMVSAACKPKEPIVSKVKGLLVKDPLTSMGSYLLLEPDEGAVFTTLKFDPALCTLPAFNVEGAFVLEDCSVPFSNEAIKHLMQPVQANLFPGDTLKIGGVASKIGGSWWQFLNGINSGKKWSGLAL
jgi:hypothetical protein